MQLQLIVRVVDDKGNVLPIDGMDLVTTKLRDDLKEISPLVWGRLMRFLGVTITFSYRRDPELSSLYPTIPYLEKQVSDNGLEESVLTWGGFSLDWFSPQSQDKENSVHENV